MITLRRPTAADAEAMFHGWGKHPEATKFLSWPTQRSLDDIHAFLRFTDEEWRQNGCGALLICEDGVVVGSTGLHLDAPHRAETGYVLAPPAWGRGVATQAVKLVVELAAQRGFARLEAQVHLENRASSRVLEKCGFQLEGVLRKYQLFPNLGRGVPEDVELWSLLPAGA